MAADLIITNARIATMDPARSEATAAAVKDGRFVAVGDEAAVAPHRGPSTRVIDAGKRRVIPGLNDSHLHVIRGGLNYNMELRWDGVPSLADAMRLLKAQVDRTPPPQWVRVVGGWSEHQFAEKRLPTLDEVNAVSADTPVFLLHLYDRALLNKAALRAVGYDRNTPAPPGTELQKDAKGEPTGLLIARPNASILYATLAKGPRLSPEDQAISSRWFMRELNRLGVTSVIDAGGGFQNYPDDYQVIERMHAAGELTVRIAYNLFTQRPKQELDDFRGWTSMVRPGQGDAFYRLNGAGEMLTFSAADFEDFKEPRPDLVPSLEGELEAVVRHLAEQRWPFRLHATYDESIARFLSVFERVHRDVPLTGLRWFFDHAETISARNIERVKALGGGIAVQHRMAYQGEDFIRRYGAQAAERTPPVTEMLRAGLPVGAGTDATRVASYDPFVSLAWLTTGRTVGGTSLYPKANLLTRAEALRLYTVGSAWFSGEDAEKGAIRAGQLADLAVLSADYFAVRDEELRAIESLLTVVGGKVVWGAGPFAHLAPPAPPVSPSWSPVATVPGATKSPAPAPVHRHHLHEPAAGSSSWGDACGCFAF